MSMATGSAQLQTEDLRKTVSMGREPNFKDQPGNDHLMEMVLALSAEISVLRDRLDTHERLAEASTAPTPEAVESYVPDDAASGQRSAWRSAFLAKLFRSIRQAAARDLLERKQRRDAHDLSAK